MCYGDVDELVLPFTSPPNVGSLDALALDAAASSLIVILYAFFQGGMFLPAALGLAISKNYKKQSKIA